MKRKWRWCHEDFDRNPLDTEVICLEILPWRLDTMHQDVQTACAIRLLDRTPGVHRVFLNWEIDESEKSSLPSPGTVHHRRAPVLCTSAMIFDVNWKDWLQRSFIVRIGQVECSDSFLSYRSGDVAFWWKIWVLYAIWTSIWSIG